MFDCEIRKTEIGAIAPGAAVISKERIGFLMLWTLRDDWMQYEALVNRQGKVVGLNTEPVIR